MSLLRGNDKLPTAVLINDTAYEIRHDFRTGIEFEAVLNDPKRSDTSRLLDVLLVWFETLPPEPLSDVIEMMLRFYRCGKDEPKSGGKRLYDFDYDDDFIYSAFLSTYGIDLATVEYLHWWRFRAMFAALPDDTQFRQVVNIRAMKIPADADAKERARIMRMKAEVALPSTDEPTQPLFESDEDFMAHMQRIRDAKAKAE